MKRSGILLISIMMLLVCCVCAACGFGSAEDQSSAQIPSASAPKELHVSADGSDEKGDGSEESPFASPAKAVSLIRPGTTVIIHKGEYAPFSIGRDASGTADAPVVIRSAEGETAVIDGKKAESGSSETIGITLNDASYISVEGLEVRNGTHGIAYFSTKGNETLSDVTIARCKVHGIRGTHGICVYAGDPGTALTGLRLTDNEVYDCECGDSESIAVNGNIDGFEISGNTVHDNDNIGIDMIGFEGTAENKDSRDDPFASDFVRNGKCHDNVVYNISSEGNEAYLDDGEYDLCAGGIYVDGGQDIEIYNNYVYNCDIGIEIATEHSSADDERFRVSGISVHDNVIKGCSSRCGLSIGGYDSDRGFTENCDFTNNTLIDNEIQLCVQRSRNNRIERNLFAGGVSAIEINTDCREKDMVNTLGVNTWAVDEPDLEDMCDFGDYDTGTLFPGGSFEKQIVTDDTDSVISGMRSLVNGTGSSFVPASPAADE